MSSAPVRPLDLDATAIDALFAAADSTRSPGYAVGIYHGGELVFAQGYGMSNLEHGVPISPRSIFHVASISKQFTDMCIALLARAGSLDPDDDIRRYVPEVPSFGSTITLRHLIHHTSGLRDQWSLLDYAGWREDDLITEADVLDVVRRQTSLNFVPGERHLYCNTGYTLLAIVVHRVSGQTLRQFAQTHLFGPLGMTSTHFHDNHREIVPSRTQAYEQKDTRWEISIPVFDVVGTTSLFTTVIDLAKWYAQFWQPTVGDAGLIHQLETRGTLNDGTTLDYAWGLSHRRFREAAVIEHSGADAGYRAHFMRLPEHDLGVAVLANFDRSGPVLLAEQLVSLVLGDRLAPALATSADVSNSAAETEAETPVAAFAGLYQNSAGDEFIQFNDTNGQLTSGLSPDKHLTYRRVGERAFRLAPYPSQLTRFATARPAPGFTRSYTGSDESTTFQRIVPPVLGADELEPFTGAFTCHEIGTTYEIRREGATLQLCRRKHPAAPLAPVLAGVFITDAFWGLPALTFTRDRDDVIDGFTIGGGRSLALRFKRDVAGWI